MQRFQWRQWFAVIPQALAIVASILVAFAVDAWWEERNDQRWQTEQLIALRDEFVANRDALIEVVRDDRRIADEVQALLSKLKGSDIGDVVLVDASNVAALTAWRTSDVATGALDALLASGLAEIEEPELRRRLAEWPSDVQNIQEDEILARDFLPNVLVPALLGQGLIDASYENQTAFFRRGATRFRRGAPAGGGDGNPAFDRACDGTRCARETRRGFGVFYDRT